MNIVCPGIAGYYPGHDDRKVTSIMDTIIPRKYCPSCEQEKLLIDFHKNKSRSDGLHGWCKSCNKGYDSQRVIDYTNSPTKTMRAVGLSRDDYARVYEQQGGVCAICGKSETSRHHNGKIKRLAVDHDHATGMFRGLLCHRCNLRLEGLEDQSFMQVAIEYLREHNEKRCILDKQGV